MQKLLIIAGIIILFIGLCWSWLRQLPIGRLPGDIYISRPNYKIYIPITSMILLSVMITLILRLIRKG